MANSGPDGTWFVTTPEYWARITMPIIGWKIWYSDRSTRDSTQCPWDDAPAQGVQCVMVYHPRGYRNVVRGRDEYTLPGQQSSKLGEEIDIDVYRQILQAAMDDTWRPD